MILKPFASEIPSKTQANNLFEIFEKLSKDQCQNIRPGDIVRVRGGDTIPADLVIISSNYDAGNAFYSTAALDGESNLKKAVSLPKTQPFSTPAEITQIRCYCEVQVKDFHTLFFLLTSSFEVVAQVMYKTKTM